MNNGNTTDSVPRQGPLWENPGNTSRWEAFFQTAIGVLFRPRLTFEQMTVSPPIGRAYLFYLLPSLGAFAGGFALEWMMRGLIASLFLGLEAPPSWENLWIANVVVLFVSPFVLGGLVHWLLIVVNGRKYGYAATFRVGAYARGSTALFSWVPCIGGCVGLVWALVVEVKGLAAIQETSQGKAAMAVLFSYGVLFVFSAIVIFLMALRESFFSISSVQV